MRRAHSGKVCYDFCSGSLGQLGPWLFGRFGGGSKTDDKKDDKKGNKPAAKQSAFGANKGSAKSNQSSKIYPKVTVIKSEA